MHDDSASHEKTRAESQSGFVDEACIRFEAAWASGQSPKIDDFLPLESSDIDPAVRRALVDALTAIDAEWREKTSPRPLGESQETSPRPLGEGPGVRAASPTDDALTLTLSQKERGSMQFPGLEILEEIAPGRGGMGMVFRARDVNLDKIVAVKTPRTRMTAGEGRDYFVREAQNAARLDHPNIVKIFRLDADHVPPYYVMEFVAGRPLDEACRGRSPEFIARLLEQTARALAYAHRKGVVHRDIKPGNILVDFEEGKPHITDFGLADCLTAPPGGRGGTSVLAGTASFIPPEVYEHGEPGGTAVDIYALGVTMYLLLTGRNPHPGVTRAEVRQKVLADDVPLPQEINTETPEPLQRICLKAMERDPSARYESAQHLADDLRRFLENREVLARPTRYDSELRGKLQNHRAEIHAWREQHLIRTAEMDSLLRPYSRLLEAESPWIVLSQRFPWETIGIRLGGWLVLLSSVLWPLFYWPKLDAFQRVLSVGGPTILLNGAGWLFHRWRSKWNARVFLGLGALLLPLLVSVILTQYNWLEGRQDATWELFARLEARGHQFLPTNLQWTIAAAVFVAYCVVLLRTSGSRLLVIWLGAGVYVLFSGLLCLDGMKEWIVQARVARALLCYLPICWAFLTAAIVWHRRGDPSNAAAIYCFFPLPLVALLTALGWYGGREWLHAYEPLRQNQIVNAWWMANGGIYGIAAMISLSSRAGFLRFWGELFLTLLPVSLLVPANLLFRQGPALGTLGGEPFTIYELLSGLLTVGFIVAGTKSMRSTLALPGTIGLTVFVFRVTGLHFAKDLAWPFSLACSGAAAMLAGVASSWLRDFWRRHKFPRQNSDKTGL